MERGKIMLSERLKRLLGKTKSTPVTPEQKAPQTSATLAETAKATLSPEIQAQREKLLWCCMEVTREKFPEHIRNKGRCFIHCDFPGTAHEAILGVERDAKDEGKLRLTARVLRGGTDMCMMHYIFCGSAEELDAYLADRKNMPELMASWVQLAEQIDKHD